MKTLSIFLLALLALLSLPTAAEKAMGSYEAADY